MSDPIYLKWMGEKKLLATEFGTTEAKRVSLELVPRPGMAHPKSVADGRSTPRATRIVVHLSVLVNTCASPGRGLVGLFLKQHVCTHTHTHTHRHTHTHHFRERPRRLDLSKVLQNQDRPTFFSCASRTIHMSVKDRTCVSPGHQSFGPQN